MNQELAELLSSMVHQYLRVSDGGSRARQLMNGFDPDVKLELHITSKILHNGIEIDLACTNRFGESASLCMWQGDRSAPDSPLPLVLRIAHAILDIPTDRWERMPYPRYGIFTWLQLYWFDICLSQFTATAVIGFKCTLPVGEIGCSEMILYFSHAFRKSELSGVHKTLLASLLSANLAADNSSLRYPQAFFQILPE